MMVKAVQRTMEWGLHMYKEEFSQAEPKLTVLFRDELSINFRDYNVIQNLGSFSLLFANQSISSLMMMMAMMIKIIMILLLMI